MRIKKNKAFTLIELLLGLGIFAIVASVLYSTFSAGLQTNRRAEKQSHVVKQAGWIFDIIAKDLERSVAFTFSSFDGNLLAFEAQEDRITFIIPSPTGLKRVSYYLADPEDSKVHRIIINQSMAKNVKVTLSDERNLRSKLLVRAEQDIMDYLSGSKEEQIEVLGSDIRPEGLKFSYQKGSEEKQVLPASVDVDIDFIAEDYPDGTLSLKRHILIPTAVFHFGSKT